MFYLREIVPISIEIIKIQFQKLRFDLEVLMEKRISKNMFSIFSALLVGNNNHLGRQQWEILQQTGTNHLLVISGLHIGLMALFGYWLGSLFSRFL